MDFDQLSHLNDPVKWLKLAQWIFNLITWSLIVSVSGYDTYKNAVYAMVVFILFWLLGLIWVFLFLSNRGDHSSSIGEKIPVFYFAYQIAACFLTFTAACAIADDACITQSKGELEKIKTCYGQVQVKQLKMQCFLQIYNFSLNLIFIPNGKRPPYSRS